MSASTDGCPDPTRYRPGAWRTAVALVTLAAVGLTAAPSQAAFPGTNGPIAYERQDSFDEPPALKNQQEIYTMPPEGAPQTDLTTNAANDKKPAFSADRKSVV